MAKVKRMMFGGAAKAVAGALGGAKKAVAAKAAPMQQQANQLQFMSDKLRGAPMTGPLGGVGKPPATPPAELNVAGIKKASAGLGDTFKGNPNIQKTDTSTGGPPLQRLSTPEQYKQAEAAYKQMQQQQQLANSVGRLPSVTADLGQLAKGATMAVPARGISRGDLRMAGLKKGGAVKSSASKRGDGIAQRGKTKGRIV